MAKISLENLPVPGLASIACLLQGILQSEDPAHAWPELLPPACAQSRGRHDGVSRGRPRSLAAGCRGWLGKEPGPFCPRGAASSVPLKERDKKGEFLQPGSIHECALQRRGNEDDDQDQGRPM